MRACRVFASSHNGRKCKPLSTLAAHEIIQFNLHFAFGQSWLYVFNEVRKRRIGDCLRSTYTLNFRSIFYCAKITNKASSFFQARHMIRLHLLGELSF